MKPKPIEVKALPEYKLWLRYSDNVQGQVSLAHLVGKGVFEFWKDEKNFQKVSITSCGAIAWSDEIDLCGDALYLRITSLTPEELFPALRTEAANA